MHQFFQLNRAFNPRSLNQLRGFFYHIVGVNKMINHIVEITNMVSKQQKSIIANIVM